ncbi:MAG TPA: hypothetical protein HA349_06925 [Methanotrichaceae archaeon]|nr:hypothetical protein [Methanotrichaceae archaeon]
MRGITGGTEERTNFVDADHDAEIDEEDVVQIEKIVNGNGDAVMNIPTLGKMPK